MHCAVPVYLGSVITHTEHPGYKVEDFSPYAGPVFTDLIK